MKISISKGKRKTIILYLVFLVLLYLVVVTVPKVTGLFQTTTIIDTGTLSVSCESSGFVVKREAIGTAEEDGHIRYSCDVGTVVAKHRNVVNITGKEDADEDAKGDGDKQKQEDEEEKVSLSYSGVMKQLDGFSRVEKSNRAPISGIFSLSMDGGEKYFSPENLDKITRKDAEGQSLKDKDLERSSVKEGDPVYKITGDNKWYIVCWMNEEDAKTFGEGEDVTLHMPEGSGTARIRSVNKEEKEYRVIIETSMYYEKLPETRNADITISGSDTTGLMLDNRCIIKKHGREGVYVRDKNGDYYFVPINVIRTDGKRSIVSETTYYDAEGQAVYTVNVYDEVLKNPKGILRKELKEEQKEKEKKTKTQ